MERSALLTLIALLLSPLVAVAGEPDNSWSLIREGEQISVYSRDVADSKYNESLAQTFIKVRLSALVALILDGNSHVRWVNTVDDSRQIDIISPTEVHNYTYSGAPWPVDDRDAIVNTQASQDSETLIVTIQSYAAPDYISQIDGVVRVPYVDSTWTLIPVGDGKIEVNFRVHSEPGGEIPTWLTNNLASDQPYYTLNNLHRFFNRENEYFDRELPFIREPGEQPQ
ncbi:hypothetical protein BOW53_13120 [Solemya pervernicosa gill symbiont]|uniref:START domain-containing protein n=2 Tax=Gammaproteobacteria incertae sedis TaxID=118884 RepID=A0A1T2L219_9GAMM|nr:START domain-containing protein [Candidatus Reidiella endopervernicosa]OOZ39070.1 hypothetical protein BOW53_13120 [Solemya pervernicosa gill symbiont]QKQ25162.1 hypothetical protein HUE57_01815 [Candidatus Reidiella endopervernicosa]